MTQQIQQFQAQRETFTMQHLGSTSEMDRILDALLSSLSEAQLEKILRKLSPEERMKGLSLEQRVEGLSAEERDQLLRLLQRKETKKPKRGKKS